MCLNVATWKRHMVMSLYNWKMSVVITLCLFFFKQETAYEMRIRDWSSDVCSSDLCGTQVSGGYFAIPGLKEVPGMDTLGFPLASIESSGDFFVTKADGTGGAVTEQTVKEQLLYEEIGRAHV